MGKINMPKIVDNDSNAVDRFKNGDTSAFDELMLRYEDRIYSFLTRMCRSRDNARDRLQDTFLTAFRYLKNFRGEASFKTWLYRIASTSCLRSLRRRKNEPSHHLSLDDLGPGQMEINRGLNAGWADSPVDELINQELREKIDDSLFSLPEKYRVVFVLRDMEDFNSQEVSKMLEISVPAVKTRLHRARLFLRKELAEYYLKGNG
jgi:RNA polymerase sigma-70 factor (ECF subfamily)